jgi:hypothetical protein
VQLLWKMNAGSKGMEILAVAAVAGIPLLLPLLLMSL